jgi:hypothetical protein
MTNALVKISQEVISNNEQLHNFLQRVKEVTNPLFPDTLNFIRPEFKLSATVVSVDTNVDKYGNNRDIYKTENGQYALHLSKLNEIAKAAGLQITDSRILERKIDEQGRVTYVLFQVKGYVKSIDGSIKEDVATGKYDYYRDLEKYSSEKQIKARRAHAEALAESNAKTRLFNKLVTKLPQSFTLEELKKPFLVPCVIEDKNELLKDLDPATQRQIKAEYARKQLGLATQIYSVPKQLEEAKYSVEEAEPQEDFSASVVAPEKEEPNPDDELEIIAEEYRDQPQRFRTQKILELIEATGYTDPNGAPITAKRIENNSVDAQIKFLKRLLDLYNKQNARKAEELPL